MASIVHKGVGLRLGWWVCVQGGARLAWQTWLPWCQDQLGEPGL